MTHDDDADVPKPPDVVWRTLIARSNLEFASLLHTPLRDFLVHVDHLAALVRHREKLAHELALYLFASLVLAFLIHLNRADLSITIASPLGEMADLPISLELLLFALSVTTAYYVQRFTSVLMLGGQIDVIMDHLGHPRHSGMRATEHVVARWSAFSIWADVLAIRPFGYRSSRAQIVITIIAITVIFALALAQLAIIVTASYVAVGHLSSVSSAWTFWVVVIPSVIAIHFALLMLFVVVFVPLRFQLYKP